MKKKESSGKKALIIIICIIVSLAFLVCVVFPWWFIHSVEKVDEETDKLIGKPIAITNVEDFEKYAEHINIFKSSEILEIDAFFTPTEFLMGVLQGHNLSGNMLVTQEYYSELKNSFDDWQLVSKKFPDAHYPFSIENITSFADSEFVSFIKNNDYYFSQKLLEENNNHWMVLISENENRVYFLFLD